MFVSRSFRCTDRSAAKCVESIFFKRKVPNENSCWKVTDCLKTAQTGSNRITAEQLKNEGALNKLIHAKEGYRFIASIDPFILPRVQNSWLSAQSTVNCNANGWLVQGGLWGHIIIKTPSWWDYPFAKIIFDCCRLNFGSTKWSFLMPGEAGEVHQYKDFLGWIVSLAEHLVHRNLKRWWSFHSRFLST